MNTAALTGHKNVPTSYHVRVVFQFSMMSNNVALTPLRHYRSHRSHIIDYAFPHEARRLSILA